MAAAAVHVLCVQAFVCLSWRPSRTMSAILAASPGEGVIVKPIPCPGIFVPSEGVVVGVINVFGGVCGAERSKPSDWL